MIRFGSRATAGAALAATIVVVGCTAARRERLFQFFFDSPPTSSSAPSDDDRPPSQIAQPVGRSVSAGHGFRSIHPSFAMRRCRNCHDPAANQAVAADFQDKCRTCHPALFEPRPFVHGPSGAFACMECHHPHASAMDHLLRQPQPGLCLICHGPTITRDARYHADLNQACTTCHESHGGDDWRMLKPPAQWRHLAPRYQPTSQPAGGASP